MKNKITLEEFWNSKENLAIHCNTEEKADKLLEAFYDYGEIWADGESYLDNNLYNYEKENTCYDNTNGFCNFEWYELHNYKIYEFEDVIFEDDK